MKFRTLVFFSAIAAVSLPCDAQTVPPLQAYASLPMISDPAVSSDGKYLAMIQELDGKPVATIRQIDALTAPPVVIPAKEGFIVHVRWANDHRLIITINTKAKGWGESVHPWYRTVAVNADGSNPAILFRNQKDRDINYSTSNIVGMANNDPDHIYMSLWAVFGTIVQADARNSIYKVDINSGDAEPMVRGGLWVSDWVMDGSGNVIARQDTTREPLMDHVVVYNNGDWKEIATVDASGGKGISAFGMMPDGKSMAVITTTDTNATTGLVAMSLADGKLSEVYHHPRFDLSGILSDTWSRNVIGVRFVGQLAQDTYFDPKYQEVQNKFNAAFPGRSALAIEWDRNFERIIMVVIGPATVPTYYLYTRSTNRYIALGRTHPQLTAKDLGPVRAYDYKARDGLDIPAYLTLPPGKEAKNLPVVVLPHGGPGARDDMSFEWESQFLANRGYVVMQPNFRGSFGYGRAFREAGYGQWGLKMQDDITDGVKKLIADGIADPKRICIVGGSYGGYAALAGAVQTPDLYACAAAWAPVTDLRMLLQRNAFESGGDESWYVSATNRLIGDRWKDADKLDAVSPAKHAEAIKVPVLLMHGEDDATVRIDQSMEMDSALRHAGKKVTFIRIKNETHYMQAQSTRERWLTELEKFLAENIGK